MKVAEVVVVVDVVGCVISAAQYCFREKSTIQEAKREALRPYT